MKITLAKVTPEDSFLIKRWLEAKHVVRYWGEPEGNWQLLSQPSTEEGRAIIVADGRKVGLILWQRPTRQELDVAGLHDVPDTVIDIDIMIGEEDAVGQGIGSAAIGIVADLALGDPSVPYLIAATSVDNTASQRAFARAGFCREREFDDVPYGRCLLMVKARTTGAGPVAHQSTITDRL